MSSDLYKMGLVMSLEQFRIRARAAVLLHASLFNMGGAASESKNFAIHILKNPMFEEVSMTALIAADPTVLGQVTMVDDEVSVDDVTDAAIKTVVTNRWSLVAAKYPIIPAV